MGVSAQMLEGFGNKGRGGALRGSEEGQDGLLLAAQEGWSWQHQKELEAATSCCSGLKGAAGATLPETLSKQGEGSPFSRTSYFLPTSSCFLSSLSAFLLTECHRKPPGKRTWEM